MLKHTTVFNTRRSFMRHGLLLGSAGLLSACGFELRKAPDYPFKTLFISVAEASLLGQELKRNIASSGRVEVITDARQIERAELISDTELVQERIISFNESAALSKEAEEQLLYRDMRSDIVQQVLRRLGAVRQL